MRFTNYLIESHKAQKLLNEKHDLVMQKVLDAVDNGHVEYSDSKIMFDIGEISDTPKLRGLKLVIRPGREDQIKLGKNKDGVYAIVIDTKEAMPGRQQIDSFLASKKIYSGFQREYKKYVSKHHDHTKEYEPSDTETKLSVNSRETFEEKYNDLLTAVSGQHEQYTKATQEIDKELDQIANVGRKTALNMAKENLKKEYLGKDAKEFVSKVLALPEAEYVKHLEKEWKEKLESRLAGYYTSNYSKN